MDSVRFTQPHGQGEGFLITIKIKRGLSQYVVLKSLNNSSDPGKAFFNEVIN